MLQKIQSWENKLPSNEGRVQLIQSVLFSIQMYWSSISILPIRSMKHFLWTGADLKHYGANVKWEHPNMFACPKRRETWVQALEGLE